ncbi:MAG TPA: GNAT family N-acetyltransferase, partial [Phycisphaerae bacterium]|nr:GNAT family N-acetyltransferase [Phycisphaerae bacterium]
PEEVTLRDLRPVDDVEFIVSFALAAWEPIWAHLAGKIGEELFAVTHPDVRADKARRIRAACDPTEGSGAAVAEIDGKIVGFVTYFAGVQPGMGSLGNNAVHPDFHGRGIAGLLYAHAFDRLRAAGMQVVHVQTGLDPAHAPARRAYEKAGFDVVGFESVNYYRRL